MNAWSLPSVLLFIHGDLLMSHSSVNWYSNHRCLLSAAEILHGRWLEKCAFPSFLCSQGQLHRHAPCALTWSPPLRRALRLLYCSAVTLLKFLIILNKGPHVFILDWTLQIISPVLSAINIQWVLIYICKLERDYKSLFLLATQTLGIYYKLVSYQLYLNKSRLISLTSKPIKSTKKRGRFFVGGHLKTPPCLLIQLHPEPT